MLDLTPDPKTEPEQTNTFKEGNISLILDTYDDLFSDFDPRPFSERAMSDDFLIECKKASRDKINAKGIELRLLIPHAKRQPGEEVKIKKRLKDHFQKHYKMKQKELKKEKRNGGIWFLMGALLIIVTTFLYDREGYLFNMLTVVMEPAGWFTTWTGLDKIFSGIKDKQPDLEFYGNMAKVEIQFRGY